MAISSKIKASKMRSSLVILLFCLVAIAYCQQDQGAVGGKLTIDQVVDKISAKYGEDTCIHLGCKQSCWAEGHKSGYCLNNACICVV